MYYILYTFLYIISLIPFRILYFISDGIYLLLYYVIGYRRDVVINNLKIAFPEKTEEELIKISKQFYHNLIDNFIEAIKLFSLSEKELNKRFTCENLELLENLYNKGLKVQANLGHLFNWELANAFFSLNSKFSILTVYMSISNKAVDDIFIKLRKRFGAKLIRAGHFKEDFVPYSSNQYCLVLVADQNPGIPEKAYWLPFFGVMTPFVKGPEKGARINKSAIIMCNFYKIKRGYYSSRLELVTEDPASLPDGEITKRMIAFIESCIRKQPANYLWSHRRWRWKFEEEKYGHLVVK